MNVTEVNTGHQTATALQIQPTEEEWKKERQCTVCTQDDQTNKMIQTYWLDGHTHSRTTACRRMCVGLCAAWMSTVHFPMTHSQDLVGCACNFVCGSASIYFCLLVFLTFTFIAIRAQCKHTQILRLRTNKPHTMATKAQYLFIFYREIHLLP